MTDLYLETHPEDVGQIIGRKGKTIKAIRTLVNLKGYLKKRRTRLYLKSDQLGYQTEAKEAK